MLLKFWSGSALKILNSDFKLQSGIYLLHSALLIETSIME